MLPGLRRRLLRSEFAVPLRCLAVNVNFVLVSSGLRRSRIRVMISARGECLGSNNNNAAPADDLRRANPLGKFGS